MDTYSCLSFVYISVLEASAILYQVSVTLKLPRMLGVMVSSCGGYNAGNSSHLGCDSPIRVLYFAYEPRCLLVTLSL